LGINLKKVAVMLNLLIKIDSILVWILKRIVGILGFWILCLLFAAVIFRYFLNRPIFWADEAATYSLVCLIFSAVYLVLRSGKMIKITFVIDLLPKSAVKIVLIITNVLIIGLMGLFGYEGMMLTYQRVILIQKTVALGIPMVVFYRMIPVMAVLLIYGSIMEILSLLFPDKFKLEKIFPQEEKGDLI